ncbi:fasciclin-like arabinogalactan protein 1 [Panicum miliaceum]|uniref:Fasciclin-like arabinogalactan protein 1 n=1 Tax=Panicum miliaceum TaxID=4540 RepID=A0A3L6RZJ9_PANMI|nr:fasciclin-like arabinogalactan protein 1 [Panicum miliaceum]
MHLAGVVTASAVLLPLFLVLAASPSCHGASSHKITDIIAAHPNFTEFSAVLISTGAAAEIDRRTTITVLAVDNAVMAQLKAQKLQPKDLEHVIYLHVLLVYFDAAKLGSIQGGFAQATSLYQATGKAQARNGEHLRVPQRACGVPTEAPYDIAVLQVSALIWSPAPAPAASPPPDAAPRLADLLSKNGCGGFAGLLAASDVAAATFERSPGGLTVFCPADKSVAAFLPIFKNLSTDDQLALLLYHGVAAHYSAQSLKAINGGVNTLATDGSKGYKYNLTVHADGDTVKLSSSSPSAAKVTKTLVDKASIAVYLIDAVLLPRELFNNGQGHTAPAPVPTSSPAHPPPPAIAPASPPAHAHTPPALAPVVAPAIPPTPRRRPAPSPEDTPAASPDADDSQPPADQKNNGARDTASWSLGTAVAAAVPVIVLLVLL